MSLNFEAHYPVETLRLNGCRSGIGFKIFGTVIDKSKNQKIASSVLSAIAFISPLFYEFISVEESVPNCQDSRPRLSNYMTSKCNLTQDQGLCALGVAFDLAN